MHDEKQLSSSDSRIRTALHLFHQHDDYDGCVRLLDEVILETVSPNAVMVKAVIMGIEFGFFDEEVYKLLVKIEEDRPELISMKHFLLATYYERDEQAIENHLRASISAYDQHVNPYEYLGFHLSRMGLIDQAKHCFDRAIDNVVQVLHIVAGSEADFDADDPDRFLEEFVIGTHKERGKFESMIEFRDYLASLLPDQP